MKTRNLRGLLAVLAVGAVLAMPARGEVSPIDLGITNTITANNTTTANVGNVLDVRGQDNCGFMFNYQGNASGTGNLVITFVRSADNVSWETTPTIKKTNALVNTTATSAFFLLSRDEIGAAGYLKVKQIQNYDASAGATNCALVAVKKTIKAAP